MQDYDKFKSYMSLLGEIHSKEISDILKDAYWIALKQFSDDQCNKAFDRAIGSCKFFPKPAELIEFISSAFGSAEDVSVLEAAKVLETVKRIGGYTSVDFDDSVTKAVIQNCFGGWEKLCSELKADEEKWFLKDFSKYYQSYARQNIKIAGRLPGRHEIKNNAIGLNERPQIEHIGNTIKRLTQTGDYFNE